MLRPFGSSQAFLGVPKRSLASVFGNIEAIVTRFGFVDAICSGALLYQTDRE